MDNQLTDIGICHLTSPDIVTQMTGGWQEVQWDSDNPEDFRLNIIKSCPVKILMSSNNCLQSQTNLEDIQSPSF